MASVKQSKVIKAIDALPKYKYYKFNEAEMLPANGFNNTGVICWFNSLLQSLMSLTSLTEVMLEYENNFIMKPLGKAYIELIKLSQDDKDITTQSAKVLEAFREALCTKKSKFLSTLQNNQECANEGFILFIDALECKRVEQIFESIYKSTIVCPICGATKTERVKSIQVPFYTDRNIGIEDFTGYVKCHRSDVSDYECPGYDMVVGDAEVDASIVPKKHERVRLTKVTELAVRHGEVIVVKFNKMFNRKRSYPTLLKFKGVNNTVIEYQLVSTIEHSGSVSSSYSSSGHYWSRGVRADHEGQRTWYNLNDTYVGLADAECNNAVSMLFYHMI